ncbi:MAG: hypothetical protein K2W95_19990 [Candidatus Obscuribacterales bacterium]|nr:hypothetical protein [Candidatus Obscuribacterales bacterium]
MRFLILALSITFLSNIAIGPASAQNMRAFAIMQQQAAQQRAAQQQGAAQQGAARAAQLRALHPAFSQQPQSYSGATPGGAFGGGVSGMMQGMGLGLAPGQSAPPSGVSGMMQGMGLGLPPGATPVPGGIGGSVYGTAQPDYQGPDIGGPGPGNPGNGSLSPQGVGSSIPAGYVDESGSGDAPVSPPLAGDGPTPSLPPEGGPSPPPGLPPPDGSAPHQGAPPQRSPREGSAPSGGDGHDGPPPAGDRSAGGLPTDPHGCDDKSDRPTTAPAENAPLIPPLRSEKTAAESPFGSASSESSPVRSTGTTGGARFGETRNGRSKFGDAFFGLEPTSAATGSGAAGRAAAVGSAPAVKPQSATSPTSENAAVVRRQPGWASAFNKIPSTLYLMDEPAPDSRSKIQPEQVRLQRR